MQTVFLSRNIERIKATTGATAQEHLADDVDATKTGRFVRITIDTPGTAWGASIEPRSKNPGELTEIYPM